MSTKKRIYESHPIVTLSQDNTRLRFWERGTCPYCSSLQTKSKVLKNGSVEFTCGNCGATNRFSAHKIMEGAPATS